MRDAWPLTAAFTFTALAWVVYGMRTSPIAALVDPSPLGIALAAIGIAFSALAFARGRRHASGRHTGIGAGLLACALLAAGLWVPHAYFGPYEAEVRFRSSEAELAGTLYTPRSEGPHPAVVMIHGSGPEARDEYAFYARLFARHGIAGLAYDKRGVGASSGELYGTDYSGYADDALAAVRFLTEHPTIDPERIGLMGMSEGEWVAPLAAGRSDDVAFVIVTSASGTSPAAQVDAEIASRLRAKGYPDSIVEEARDLNARVFDYQRSGEDRASLQASLDAAAEQPWFGDADDIPARLGSFEDYAWWRSVMDFDARGAWERVEVPVLVLKGGRDLHSPADAMRQNIEAALEAGGNHDHAIVVFPEADHMLLQWPLGRGVPPPVFARGYLDTLLRWTGEAATRPRRRLDRAAARAYVDSLRTALSLPALSVALADDGRVVWEYATGWADSASARPATPESAFRIGSVTKLLTAAAALRLEDRGMLDLDAPVRRLVPAAPDSDPPITVRHLAGHLGGIRHYGRDDFVSRTAYPDVRSSLSRFVEDPLVAPPGSTYAYSSYGYNLLGAALERAAGTDFRTLVQQEVVDPLALQSMRPSSVEGNLTEVSYFVSGSEGRPEEAPFVDLSDRWPSGGYVGTAADLARFGSAVFGERYLSEAARGSMLTPMQDGEGDATGVGVGWRLGADEHGRRIAHHGGEAMGSRGFLLARPDEATAVALLTNLSFAPIGLDEALRIEELLLGRQ